VICQYVTNQTTLLFSAPFFIYIRRTCAVKTCKMKLMPFCSLRVLIPLHVRPLASVPRPPLADNLCPRWVSLNSRKSLREEMNGSTTAMDSHVLREIKCQHELQSGTKQSTTTESYTGPKFVSREDIGTEEA
jgi:hypothetical protein